MTDSAIADEIKSAPILVVDDNASNVVLLQEILRHAGYTHVEGETDPRKVVPLCETTRFELLLLDIRMPHLDGFQLMDRLRPLFGDDFPPIIVLTAQTDQETRRKSLKMGARDFLTKPVVTWELLQRVWNMLEIRVLYNRIHHQNRILEARVGMRTQELSLALEAARKADRAKMDFLAVMSHELRTPLNAIIGFAEEIASQSAGPLAPDYLDYVRLIESGGKTLLTMVNNILDYTKGATGTVELNEAPVEVRSLLRFCLTVVQPKAQARQVALALADGPSIMLRADERRMREMVLGVLDNAIKFNRPGGRVGITVDTDADAVVITVTDTGSGIAPDVQAHIFEPFMQAEGALQRRHDGIGMGLALVRRFAGMHGGHVELDSEVGQGTTIRITLPGSRRID